MGDVYLARAKAKVDGMKRTLKGQQELKQTLQSLIDSRMQQKLRTNMTEDELREFLLTTKEDMQNYRNEMGPTDKQISEYKEKRSTTKKQILEYKKLLYAQQQRKLALDKQRKEQ